MVLPHAVSGSVQKYNPLAWIIWNVIFKVDIYVLSNYEGLRKRWHFFFTSIKLKFQSKIFVQNVLWSSTIKLFWSKIKIKQDFLLVCLGSINYSLILCLEWKGGRHYPSADEVAITVSLQRRGRICFGILGSQVWSDLLEPGWHLSEINPLWLWKHSWGGSSMT